MVKALSGRLLALQQKQEHEEGGGRSRSLSLSGPDNFFGDAVVGVGSEDEVDDAGDDEDDDPEEGRKVVQEMMKLPVWRDHRPEPPLVHLLAGRQSRGLLKRFARTICAEENVMLWEDIQRFKLAEEGDDRVAALRRIMEDFLSPSGKHAANIKGKERERLLLLWKEQGKLLVLEPDLFDLILKEVVKVMQLDLYPKLLAEANQDVKRPARETRLSFLGKSSTKPKVGGDAPSAAVADAPDGADSSSEVSGSVTPSSRRPWAAFKGMAKARKPNSHGSSSVTPETSLSPRDEATAGTSPPPPRPLSRLVRDVDLANLKDEMMMCRDVLLEQCYRARVFEGGTLPSILGNSFLFGYLSQLSVILNLQEDIKFYLRAQTCLALPAAHQKARALILIGEDFFSEQSVMKTMVNISPEVRAVAWLKITGARSDAALVSLLPAVLDDPLKDILTVLNQELYPRFLKLLKEIFGREFSSKLKE